MRAIAILALVSTPWIAPQANAAEPGAEKPYVTTDDVRRIPVPPVDETKQPLLVIKNGTLIDGTNGAPLENATIILRGNHVWRVGPSASVSIPTDVQRTIDAAGMYVVPGLIDLHIHIDQQRGENFRRYRDSDAAAAIRATLLSKQLVDAGITSIRVPGTRSDVAVRLRDAIERGILDGPRVFQSGKLIVTRGGHGDEMSSTATGMPSNPELINRFRVATGPWDWRLAVREQIREGANWIKITSPFDREEAEAAINEAHMLGLPVMCDCFGKYSTWAAEAGLDSIEHTLDLSAQSIDAMAKHGTALVPTLTAFYNVVHGGYPSAGIPSGGFYYTMSRRYVIDHAQNIERVRLGHKKGLRIGVGTDIPFDNERRYPEDYYRELGFLKEAGMSDREVLAAATRVGADILKLSDKLGTLEPGKLADVLILQANPLVDVQNVRQVRYVISNGKVVREQ